MELFNESTLNKPVRDLAYEHLKQAIITGELTPGSRIIETTFAEQLHISRTPLREALRKLERDGLVEYILRRGVVVRAFTLNDIKEIFVIRNAMMTLILPSIVKKAQAKDFEHMEKTLFAMDDIIRQPHEEQDVNMIAKLNREFHGYFEHISGKKRILSVIDNQEEYIKRFSGIAIASIERRTLANQEHHQILDALKQKDLQYLEMLIHHHFEESKETCLNALVTRGFYKKTEDDEK